MTAAAARSVEAREVLAQQMARTTAQHLAFAVQQRDPGLIEALLLPLSVQELWALAVVLADQAPPARSRPEDGIHDEVSVQRAAGGERVALTRAERDAAIRVMSRRRGAGRGRVAAHFGVGEDTVRQVLAAPAPVQGELEDCERPPRTPKAVAS